ncbi:MAG: hypothetical protein OXF84_02450 [Bacteroidetes bacterium]|nr:hypothetical protein [Bacteroidota bacterium]
MSTSSAIEHLRFKKVSESLDELELFFKNAFEENYKNAKLELIRVRKPRFFEDPDYLRIAFVYSSPGRLGTQKIGDFIALMRLKLEEIDEERFPAMSYIEYNDYLENAPKELLA